MMVQTQSAPHDGAAASPNAMNAFSPIHGATAIGRFAYKPINKHPNTADKIVVAPPMTSTRTLDPRSRSISHRSIHDAQHNKMLRTANPEL